MTSGSLVSHLVCSDCRREYPAGEPAGLCECGRPLLVRYDLATGAKTLDRDAFHHRDGLWQWRPLLPLPADGQPVTLGEGGTPLLEASALADVCGLHDGRLLIKDEGQNPTGSFKARGMTLAVTMAVHFGIDRIVVPTAGNAGGALAAYGARAGIRTRVIMPKDAPAPNRIEADAHGAELELIDGLITDCGRRARELVEQEGWFDVSTLKEPYRIEGKKTMGYELACALDWKLPDVILYPTGGGTGLIGMWKAFDEMQAMGWIGPERPRMVTVQAAGCAPIVRAFQSGADTAAPWEDAHTLAAGLRVPAAVGDKLMLEALRESQGHAIAIDDEEMIAETFRTARSVGIFPAPEGAACVSAARRLVDDGFIGRDETVVVFNTGSAFKYIDLFEAP